MKNQKNRKYRRICSAVAIIFCLSVIVGSIHLTAYGQDEPETTDETMVEIDSSEDEPTVDEPISEAVIEDETVTEEIQNEEPEDKESTTEQETDINDTLAMTIETEIETEIEIESDTSISIETETETETELDATILTETETDTETELITEAELNTSTQTETDLEINTVIEPSDTEEIDQAVAYVQALIDALPNPDDITADNADEITEKITEIDTAIGQLTDEQAAKLNKDAYFEVSEKLVEINRGGAKRRATATGTVLTLEEIQALIDALPSPDEINKDNADDVLMNINVIKEAIKDNHINWVDNKIGELDIAKYREAYEKLIKIKIDNGATIIDCGTGYSPVADDKNGMEIIEIDIYNDNNTQTNSVGWDDQNIRYYLYDSTSGVKGAQKDEVYKSDIVIPDYVYSYTIKDSNIILRHYYEVTELLNVIFKDYQNIKINNVEIGRNISSIDVGYRVFKDTSLNTVEFKGNIDYFGKRIFEYCKTIDNVTISGRVGEINEGVFKDSKTSLETLTISGVVDEIKNKAFSGYTSLNTVILNDVSKISSSAFENCSNLENLTISLNVGSIEENAFAGCTKLNVEITGGKDKNGNINGVINDGVFDALKNAKSLKISGDVKTIGDRAFDNFTNVTSIEIQEGVETIGEGAFSGCTNLEEIVIPSSVKVIYASAFSGCSSLTSVEIPYGVTKIEDSTFYGCSQLSNVEIPTTVKEIGKNVFNSCSSITEISIPSGVTAIDNGTFQNCTSLESIEIPFDFLGTNVFKGCTNLKSIGVQCNSPIFDSPNQEQINKLAGEIGVNIDPKNNDKYTVEGTGDANGNNKTSGIFFKTHDWQWKSKDGVDKSDTIYAYCQHGDESFCGVKYSNIDEENTSWPMTTTALSNGKTARIVFGPNNVTGNSMTYKNSKGVISTSVPNEDGTYTAKSVLNEVPTNVHYSIKVTYEDENGIEIKSDMLSQYDEYYICVTATNKERTSSATAYAKWPSGKEDDDVASPLPTLSGSAGGEGGGEAEEEKPIIIKKTYGDEPFKIYPSGVGREKITDVTFKASDSEIISITGNTVTILKSGFVTVTPTYHMPNGDTTELPKITIIIAKAPLTVKADDILDLTQGTTMPNFTYTVTGLIGTDTFTNPVIATTAPDTNTAGTYEIKITGGIPSNPSYAITYENGTLIINEPTITSTRNSNKTKTSKTYKGKEKSTSGEPSKEESLTKEPTTEESSTEELTTEEPTTEEPTTEELPQDNNAAKGTNHHIKRIIRIVIFIIIFKIFLILIILWKRRKKDEDEETQETENPK